MRLPISALLFLFALWVPCSVVAQFDDDQDGFFTPADCDDTSAAIYPGEAEVCDNVDNNCDGQVDEGGPSAFADNDGDGYGDPNAPVPCGTPGAVSNNTDCNDNNAQYHPGAEDLFCEGADVDCDGSPETWYRDEDGDGFGDALSTQHGCTQPIGYVLDNTDCDDTDAAFFPGNCPPTCSTADLVLIAENYAALQLEGLTLECGESGDPVSCLISDSPVYMALSPSCKVCAYDRVTCQQSLAASACFDQFGQPLENMDSTCQVALAICDLVFNTCVGLVDADGDGYFSVVDCDDSNAAIRPEALEICDGLDNDCDGFAEEGMETYADNDGDGFGDPQVIMPCDTPGVANNLDCDDNNAALNPGALEVCDGQDNDCDGTVDEGLGNFYADADGDGLGDPGQPVPCTTPGAVQNNGDCDDTDPTPCGVVVIEGLVERRVVASAGGAAQFGGVHLEWTVGEALVSMIENNGIRLTQGFHQNPTYLLRLNLRALLQGPYVNATVQMSDDLRSGGWLPFTEPYTAAGYAHVEGGNETASIGVLAVLGTDAIVDWIVVELRDPASPEVVICSRTGLLQRDGDIVDVDGFSPLAFKASAANYRVAVLHRNHLPVITAAPIPLSPAPVDVDLTDGSTALYGVEPTRTEGAVQLLWSGNVNADGSIRYTGAFNDRDPILVTIGGIIPTNTINGYLPEDVNMDGTVKYTGANNDRDVILLNIGGIVPTDVRNAQMP